MELKVTAMVQLTHSSAAAQSGSNGAVDTFEHCNTIKPAVEPACAAPKRMAAPRRFMFFFCGRGKVGRGDNNRLLRDESFESCLAEQRCSVPCDLCNVLFSQLSNL